MAKQVKVWYLYNSGFAVSTDHYLFIFDYYKDTTDGHHRSLSTGVIDSDEINKLILQNNKQVFVFSSHSHSDHFNPIILEWHIRPIFYILSSDIKCKKTENVYRVKQHQTLTVGGVNIHTLDSTDEGVAFIVQADGTTLFHAGDLNWWYWPEEGTQWNNDIENKFKNEISQLTSFAPDISFIPVDPRLEKGYDLALKYCIDHVLPEKCHILPMHFGDDYRIFDWISKDPQLSADQRIEKILKRGSDFLF